MTNSEQQLVVVDDDDCVLERIERSLPRSGWKLTSFQCPVAAIDHLSTNVPDVLISDQRMQPLHGVEMLAELHDRSRLLGVRVFLASSMPLHHDEADQARAVGAVEIDKDVFRNRDEFRAFLEAS